MIEYLLNKSFLQNVFKTIGNLVIIMAELKGQLCHMCGAKELTLREEVIEIPYFGRVFVLSMDCNACGYRKSDVEPAERKEPSKYTIEIDSEEDMAIKIVKSGEATIKIPRIITIEPGPTSNGYVTNVEGLLERVKKIIQSEAESEDDLTIKKKAKNILKKLNKVEVGREKIKIIIEDPSGHSAIVSEKAQKGKL